MEKKYFSLVTLLSSVLYPVGSVLFCLYTLLKGRTRISYCHSISLGLFFGAVGYNINFKAEADLDRYFETISDIGSVGLFEYLSQREDGLYVKDTIFWVIAQTDDVHLLGFLVGFLVYSIVFYILIDIVNRQSFYLNKKYTWTMTGIIFFSLSVTNPSVVISNVRNISAFCLIILAAYRDFVQKKMNWVTLALYFLPLGMHTSALVLIILRIFVTILQETKEKLVGYLFPIVAIVVFPIFSQIVLPELSKLDIPFISATASRALIYVNWNSGGWVDQILESRRYWVERVYGTVTVIAILVVLRANIREKGERIFLFFWLIGCTCLAVIWIKTGAFWRFEALLTMFCGIAFIPRTNYENLTKNNDRKASHAQLFCLWSTIVTVPEAFYVFASYLDVYDFVVDMLGTSPLYFTLSGLYNIAAR